MQKLLVRTLLAVAISLSASLACAQDDLSLLPKYGSSPKTEIQKDADAKFIAALDEQYHGDRNRASTVLAARGWQYLRARDFADAMRRFNQAWLLNNSNGTALWGMAAVQASLDKFDDSLKLFAEAQKFFGEEIDFSVDYARAIGMDGIKRGDDAMLNDAFSRFERLYQKAPKNTNNLQNWAITLAGTGRYSEAWAKVKLAETTPNKDALDPDFLAALQARMPRPQD
jgi:tetratricopeptide (TPR) repeat protein